MNVQKKAGRLVEFRKKKSEKHVKYTNKNIINVNKSFLQLSQDRPYKHNCLELYYRLCLESMKSRHKTIFRIRVHWGQYSIYPFTGMGSIAMFWHPTRINMSYKLNACYFFQRTMFSMSHSFDCVPTDMVLAEALIHLVREQQFSLGIWKWQMTVIILWVEKQVDQGNDPVCS